MTGPDAERPVPADPGVLLWVLAYAAGVLWCAIVGALALALRLLGVI